MGRKAAWFGGTCLLLASVSALAGCTVGHLLGGDEGGRPDDPRNPKPANYKSDIIASLRLYLNNPTEIKDASVSEPIMQSIGGRDRFVVCVRLNARKSDGQFTGSKDYVAVFVTGRLDRWIDAAKDQCATADYQPFPEIETRIR
jgi:hypothetical protein